MSETLDSTIEMGNMKTVKEIARRLTDLPEFGCRAQFERVISAVSEAERMEVMAADARESARTEAMRLLKQCRENWTADEINEATGY